MLADDDRSTEARRKPDSAERRCLAARRRVERQQENVAQVDERIARVTTAQAACSGKRECERDRRAFEAAIARKQHYLKQLARLQQEAKDACPAMP